MMDAVVRTIMPVAGVIVSHILLRATVLLCIAGLVALVMKRASAADRYAVWSVAFVALIALPVLALMLPPWHLGQVARLSTPTSTSSQSSEVTTVGVAPRGGSTTAAVVAAAERADRATREVLGVGAVAVALMVMWLGGAALMLVRLLLHMARVSAVTLRAPEGRFPDLVKLALPIMEHLGIRRPVRVAVSDQVSQPFSWGVDNPVVVFPESVGEWPADRKRSVMWHEMAHVARLDYPLHILVEVAKALYWPNPLVWLAARRMAMERERACDDMALRNGTSAGDYATHLLDIARSQIDGYAPVGATTMAGEPGLVERVRYVMNERLDRSPLGRDRMLLTAVLAVVLALPLASLDVVAMNETIPPTVQCICLLYTSDAADDLLQV